MRVLLSASTFPLRQGDGLPRFVFDLARALTAHMEVFVLAPGAPGATSEETWERVHVRRFPYFLPRSWQALAYGDGIDVNLRRSWRARLNVPAFLAAQLRATRSLAARERIDLVNSHWILPQGWTAAAARGRRRRFAHVVSLHGGDAHLLARLPAKRGLARWIVGRSDGLVASSTHVRDVLDGVLGESSGADVQPMGVWTEPFGSGEPPHAMPFPEGYLLYVGRLQEIKGISVLLRALPKVRQQRPGLGLVIVGYGAEEVALRHQARGEGLAEVVHFAGRQPAPEVSRWLRGCRAAVIPSLTMPGGRAEGMPTVVLEAMAAGAPLVATRTGGIPDVVEHGRNGFLCRDRDPDDLAAAILEALDAPPEITQAARTTAETHTWPQIAHRYHQYFQQALGR